MGQVEELNKLGAEYLAKLKAIDIKSVSEDEMEEILDIAEEVAEQLNKIATISLLTALGKF